MHVVSLTVMFFDIASFSNAFWKPPAGWLWRPIFGRRLNAPHIIKHIQGQSEQPKLLVLSDQDAVYYTRSEAGSGGETSNWTAAPIFSGRRNRAAHPCGFTRMAS
jgi:hypothetical protein